MSSHINEGIWDLISKSTAIFFLNNGQLALTKSTRNKNLPSWKHTIFTLNCLISVVRLTPGYKNSWPSPWGSRPSGWETNDQHHVLWCIIINNNTRSYFSHMGPFFLQVQHSDWKYWHFSDHFCTFTWIEVLTSTLTGVKGPRVLRPPLKKSHKINLIVQICFGLLAWRVFKCK